MMKTIINIAVTCTFAFVGWGWSVNRRWVILTFRTLTFEFAWLTLVLWLIDNNWMQPKEPFIALVVIPFIIIPLFFFWELIPFPIIQIKQDKGKFTVLNRNYIQFFRGDGIITIRLQKAFSGYDGISSPKNMKHNPERFIYPYIQDINISPILGEQEYLLIRCCLFSALPYNLELSNVEVCLFIKGIITYKQRVTENNLSTNKTKVKKCLNLYAEHPNELSDLRIYLTKDSRNEIIKYYQENKPIEVCLVFTGLDEMNNSYSLQTSQTVIALLNGGELYKNDAR